MANVILIETLGRDQTAHTRDGLTQLPQFDTKYPEATTYFLKLPLTDESRRKILWDNCVRLYNIPRE